MLKSKLNSYILIFRVHLPVELICLFDTLRPTILQLFGVVLGRRCALQGNNNNGKIWKCSHLVLPALLWRNNYC